MKKLHKILYRGGNDILTGPDGIYKECNRYTGEPLTIPSAYVVTKVGNQLFVSNNYSFMETVGGDLTIENTYKLLYDQAN